MSLPLDVSSIVLAYLLDDGILVREIYEYNPRALQIALKYLLECQENPSSSDVEIFADIQSITTSLKLEIAVVRGSVILVRYFLDQGIYRDGLLITAVQLGHSLIVELLLDRGENLHANDDEALRVASLCGHSPVAELLLDRKADVHARSDHPLVWASCNGYLPIVKLLLDRKADIHARSDNALILASENGQLNMVEYLLDQKADPYAKDSRPLQRAISSGHSQIVDLLLKYMNSIT